MLDALFWFVVGFVVVRSIVCYREDMARLKRDNTLSYSQNQRNFWMETLNDKDEPEGQGPVGGKS